MPTISRIPFRDATNDISTTVQGFHVNERFEKNLGYGEFVRFPDFPAIYVTGEEVPNLLGPSPGHIQERGSRDCDHAGLGELEVRRIGRQGHLIGAREERDLEQTGRVCVVLVGRERAVRGHRPDLDVRFRGQAVVLQDRAAPILIK